MGRFALAWRTFWRVWREPAFAGQVERLGSGAATPTPTLEAPSTPLAKSAGPATKPARSEALTLLATLQHEARLIDFLKEPLADYSAEQIRAAVLNVHRDCNAVLERFFTIRPLVADAEGSRIELPAGFDAAKYRLTGQVTGAGPFRGTLQHPGWKATQAAIPTWSGSEDSALVLAPAEVEVNG